MTKKEKAGVANRSIRGKIVLKYLNDDQFKNVPSLTLARAIWKENKMDFKDVEHARSVVRYYRGAKGKHDRKALSITEHLKEGKLYPFTLPEEESKDKKPIKLKGKDFGIISDIHIPYHRNQAIQIALDNLEGIDHLIINGDLMDNTAFSNHAPIDRRPTPHDVNVWFDKVEYFLEYLRNEFPTQPITWFEGNHDKWFRRWLLQHGAELSEDKYFTIQERLHLDEYGVTYVPENRYGMMGLLAIHHGHLVLKGFFSPVNASRGAFMKTFQSIIIGHVHVESSHSETDIHGNLITCFSTGCLCDLRPEYTPIVGKACHGFARVKILDKEGRFEVTNKRIHKNKLY